MPLAQDTYTRPYQVSIGMKSNKFNILLIGDHCEDIYQFGTIDRISPEAPVPVFKLSYHDSKSGMAANVACNLRALGCQVHYLHGETSIKTRIIDLRSKQHIVRIDNDIISKPIQVNVPLDGYDAIVISDYAKGTVTYDIIEQIRKQFGGPIFMDTKKNDIARFRGIFVKINELEYQSVVSINDSLIVTLGDKGAMYKSGPDPDEETVYSGPKVQVVDVTGAGDTFLSAFAFEFLRTNNHSDAIAFANRAAGVTVQNFGVYAPTLGEIECLC